MHLKIAATIIVVCLGGAALYHFASQPPPPPPPTSPAPGDPVFESGVTGGDIARAMRGGRQRREQASAEYEGYWLPQEGWTGVVDHTNDILGGPTVNIVEGGVAVPGGLLIAGKLADPATPLPAKGARITIRGRFMVYRITPVGARIDLDAVTFFPAK